MKEEQDTYFAPAYRKPLEEIREEANEFFKNHFMEILNSIPDNAIIVNEERQVVFLNQSIIQMLGITDIEEAMGARPGEIFNCLHSRDHIDGCGSGQACRYCGPINVVLQSLKTNNRTSEDCRITSNFDGQVINFDLKVTAQPFNLKGKKFVMVFLSDISNQKRREQFEKIFLHDLLNILTTLSGLIEIFPNEGLNSKQEIFFSQIKESSHLLVEEFRAQRDLIAAENNMLIINSHMINSIEIIKSMIKIVKFQSAAMEKEIKIDSNSVSFMIETDFRLLHRVLLNLVKNALEASVPGDIVNIGCSISDQNIVFWVRNPFVMTEGLKSQIFQRSFSTKGTGRGLGTYSVKLLTERYLGGRVDFQSTKEKGTIFYIYLPINGEDHE